MFTVNCIEKTKIKRKRGREWPIFLKKRKIASRRVKSKRERERERQRQSRNTNANIKIFGKMNGLDDV